jgi:4'-phosphopantetheinyl transferase
LNGLDGPTEFLSATVQLFELSLPCSHSMMARALVCISPDERRRAERFVFESDRRRFIIGRYLVRTEAARYFECDPLDVPLRVASSGAPELTSGPHISIAHCRERIIVAFCAGMPVGVDVEFGRDEVAPGLSNAVFSVQEMEAYQSIPEEARSAFFYWAWTRKEAVLKALGEGLRRDPRSVSVLKDELQIHDGTRGEATVNSRLEDGYHYAVAVLAQPTAVAVARPIRH